MHTNIMESDLNTLTRGRVPPEWRGVLNIFIVIAYLVPNQPQYISDLLLFSLVQTPNSIMTKWFFLLAVISIGLAQEEVNLRNINVLCDLIIYLYMYLSVMEVVKPSFRIVAPQVICTDIKDSNAEKPKQITIRYS